MKTPADFDGWSRTPSPSAIGLAVPKAARQPVFHKMQPLLGVLLAFVVLVVTALTGATLTPTAAHASTTAHASRAQPPVHVIVRAQPGASARAASLVGQVGGRVERRLSLIDGFIATVPTTAVERLRRLPGVSSVTPDSTVRLTDSTPTTATATATAHSPLLGAAKSPVDNSFGDSAVRGTMFEMTQAIGANSLWAKGITGKGVDVALIDSGVVGVNGLSTAGKVINGPDLSLESQDPQLTYLDTNGHGTHMAGIIAGRDTEITKLPDPTRFAGVAPDARVLSLKLATANGTTDVSQLIAGIDWVVQHKTDNGMNIRVLNLSFGTDSVQPYLLDPLAYAAEVAWRKGIVVVVAAGNEGTSLGRLTNPAIDPFVIAAGAADTNSSISPTDDAVAAFSSRGNGTRNPDLLAPGKSIPSLRNPGSDADRNYPAAVTGTRFFRGSGTSQAAAMLSGAAALLIQQRPTITPDQLKVLLRTSARSLGADAKAQGAGIVDVDKAYGLATPAASTAAQSYARATGVGSLELARGSYHVVDDTYTLAGEVDVFGRPFVAALWAPASLAGTSWSGGTWNGTAWTGSTWSASSWSGTSWAGRMWSGRMWSGRMWSDTSWSRNAWSGRMWSGRMWS
jgi:subtilisin family serine protease